MSPNTSRRSLLQGCLASASVALAGCSTSADDSKWDSRGEKRRSGLAILNETSSEQRVKVTLYKLGTVQDSENLPRTLTAETPQPAHEPLFEDEYRIDADDSKWVNNGFSKPDDPTEFRVFVHLDGGVVDAYAFDTHYGSGLMDLIIEILSPTTVRFSRGFV